MGLFCHLRDTVDRTVAEAANLSCGRMMVSDNSVRQDE